MPQRWYERLVTALRKLKQLPAVVRMGFGVAKAQGDVAQRDYLAAERRLIDIYGLAPPGTVERTPTNLLMALVSLRLGNARAAAELAPLGVEHVANLRRFANA